MYSPLIVLFCWNHEKFGGFTHLNICKLCVLETKIGVMLAWLFFPLPSSNENVFGHFSMSSMLLDLFLFKCEWFCQPHPAEAPTLWLLPCNPKEGFLFPLCAWCFADLESSKYMLYPAHVLCSAYTLTAVPRPVCGCPCLCFQQGRECPTPGVYNLTEQYRTVMTTTFLQYSPAGAAQTALPVTYAVAWHHHLVISQYIVEIALSVRNG